MRKHLRACATIGVPLIATAAIAFGPLGMSPDDDVVIPQRDVTVDPTSLDFDVAELYRAVTESAGYLPEDGAPPARERVEDLQFDEDSLNVAPSGGNGERAAKSQDPAAALAHLAAADADPRAHRSSSLPSGLAVSDADPVTGDAVAKLLDLVAGIDLSAPATPPPATGEATAESVPEMPVAPAEVAPTVPVAEAPADAGTGNGSALVAADPGATTPGTSAQTVHDAPVTQSPGTGAALTATEPDRSEEPAEAPEVTKAEAKRELAESASEAGVSAADSGKAAGKKGRTNSGAPATTAPTFGDQLNSTLKDIGRSMKKAVENLRPAKKASPSADSGE